MDGDNPFRVEWHYVDETYYCYFMELVGETAIEHEVRWYEDWSVIQEDISTWIEKGRLS